MRGNFNPRKPFTKKKCLGCDKEFVYNGNPYKKYCDNVCQNIYQNAHGTRTKPIPYTKEFLEKLYIENKLSVLKIARQLNTNLVQVHRWLKRYEIPTRAFSTKGTKGNLGTKWTIESRKKLSENRKGAGSPTWKGGVTPEHKRIRNTMELKLWRKAVLERDNKTCQICGIRKEKGIEVDHIKPFARFPELRTSIENGRVVCNPCHRKTDTYAMRTTKLSI